MTFEELNEKTTDLVDQAIQDHTPYPAILGVLAAQMARIQIMWAMSLGIDYVQRRQQSQGIESDKPLRDSE